VVEVEAIGEFVSPVRRDLFLVGVSVTTCNREESAVRGRIGEGGKSKRGGVGSESESGCVFAIRETRPRRERTTKEVEDGRDTATGTEPYFSSRRCRRCVEGVGRRTANGKRQAARTLSNGDQQFLFGNCRRRLLSLLPCV